MEPHDAHRAGPVRPASALLASLMLCAVLAEPASAVSIGFDPEVLDVALGASVTVDVVFSDLGGEIISAYDLDITYDPAVVDATGVVFTTSLGDELFFETLNAFDVSAAGTIDLAQLSLLPDPTLEILQPGDPVTVATLLFDTVGVGTTELGFVFDAFNDVKGRDGLIVETLAEGGSIRVQDPGPGIPEPSGALLFAVGVALLHGRLDRRRQGGHRERAAP